MSLSPPRVACVVATLVAAVGAHPSIAATRHVTYRSAGPVPAWACGVEWGEWDNMSDASFLPPKAGPPGGLSVGWRFAPALGLSVSRLGRAGLVRLSWSHAEVDFGINDPPGSPGLSLGKSAFDQFRVAALYSVWSVRRRDDRDATGEQWIFGLLTGPALGWTRLADPRASAPGAALVGIERMSGDSVLQFGWEWWMGGPVGFDGPLAHVLLFVDLSVTGPGRDLVRVRTTPGSAVGSGGLRVTPSTILVGISLLRNLEPRHP